MKKRRKIIALITGFVLLSLCFYIGQIEVGTNSPAHSTITDDWHYGNITINSTWADGYVYSWRSQNKDGDATSGSASIEINNGFGAEEVVRAGVIFNVSAIPINAQILSANVSWSPTHHTGGGGHPWFIFMVSDTENNYPLLGDMGNPNNFNRQHYSMFGTASPQYISSHWINYDDPAGYENFTMILNDEGLNQIAFAIDDDGYHRILLVSDDDYWYSAGSYLDEMWSVWSNDWVNETISYRYLGDPDYGNGTGGNWTWDFDIWNQIANGGFVPGLFFFSGLAIMVTAPYACVRMFGDDKLVGFGWMMFLELFGFGFFYVGVG